MNDNQDSNKSYSEFLEILKIEFGDFIRLCESGRIVRHAALKSRKKSIKLRELLKDFRVVSLENDQRITKILQEAKRQIEEDEM